MKGVSAAVSNTPGLLKDAKEKLMAGQNEMSKQGGYLWADVSQKSLVLAVEREAMHNHKKQQL